MTWDNFFWVTLFDRLAVDPRASPSSIPLLDTALHRVAPVWGDALELQWTFTDIHWLGNPRPRPLIHSPTAGVTNFPGVAFLSRIAFW